MEKYKDPALPVDERVEDQLSRMTLEEKAAQLCGNLAVSFMEDGKVDMDALREQFSGWSRPVYPVFTGRNWLDPMVIAEVTNQLQHFFVEETRLGIPGCTAIGKPLRVSGGRRDDFPVDAEHGVHLAAGTAGSGRGHHRAGVESSRHQFSDEPGY